MVPVITELSRAGVPCSVDTTRAAVAAAAAAAGAALVNDVSGGLADPEMAAVVADAGLPWVLMHWRAPQRDDDRPRRATATWSPTSGPSCGAGSTRRWPPASAGARSCWTRVWVSPSAPSTTGRCWHRLAELPDAAGSRC